ncbi:hypothetical protein [Archaeoglobus veneficus]|uniref:Uncharacterized protein n=1 Tax=Archaeoglobus veneficus (strain DSM 11195 / SNP6) TaxID=693661 RepID=F2KSJ6_ARCVS|nr:hypothetical protein [Archaeoglobus veneficus]AEA48066.1 hypothetical protein Arcve_2076 [Archaeoglobus veneficus SNP6]
MNVKVFDDRLSLIHLPAGIAAYFFPAFFIVFLFYELIEFCLKAEKRKEKVENFIGDLFEFFAGVSAVHFFMVVSGIC